MEIELEVLAEALVAQRRCAECGSELELMGGRQIWKTTITNRGVDTGTFIHGDTCLIEFWSYTTRVLKGHVGAYLPGRPGLTPMAEPTDIASLREMYGLDEFQLTGAQSTLAVTTDLVFIPGFGCTGAI